MDVRLPDGTIVQNVPDGMSKADLTAKLAANGYDTSKLAASQPQDGGLFSGSIGSQIRDAASAFGHHVMNIPHGIAQGVENIVNAGVQSLPGKPVDANNPNPSFLDSLKSSIGNTVASDNAAMAQREKDYQARTPDSAGAYLGATTGEIAPFLASAVAAPIRAAGDMVGKIATTELPQKMISGATQGAIIGAAQPVTSPDYWGSKGSQIETGAITGGVMPLAVRGVQNAAAGIKDAVQPITDPQLAAAKRLAATTGLSPQDLANALRNPTQYVEGSTPTTAQVLATPEAVQLEKAMRNNPEFAGKLEAVNNANNAARLNAINSVAGAPGELESAQAARASTAQELYQKAFDGYDPANVTPWVKGQITQLMQRPAMQSAMKDAQTLAKNEGLSLTDSNSVQGLHYAKMALDDQISTATRDGNNNAVRALMGTKNQLLTVINKLSPGYQEAMDTYAQMSKPINTMEVGRDMQDQLWSKAMNSAGDPALQYQGYRAALAKALKNAPYGINPEAESVLNNVQNDLQRQTISNSLRLPGSDTNYNGQAQGWLSRQLYGPDFTGSGGASKAVGSAIGAGVGAVVGHPMGGAAIGAGASLGLSRAAASRVNSAMTEIMLSPDKAADALSRLKPVERTSLMAKLLEANPMTQQLMQSATNAP